MGNDHMYVQMGNVRIGPDGAAEMDETRTLVHVPRAEIRQIEAAFTIGAERPLIMLIIGVALVAIAVTPALALIDVYRRGGTYYVEWIAAVACIIPGIWLIQLSVRRRWVLIVTMSSDRRKLLFPKTATQPEVESFVAQAKSQFGYT